MSVDASIIATAILSGVATGIVSAIGTVAALRVSVRWAHSVAETAHKRIDAHAVELKDHGNRIAALEGRAK